MYREVMQDELSLDGVRYARLQHGGETWCLAGTNPNWRQELMPLGAIPDAYALEALAARGICLARESAALPLAVMCGGMGASWPGMGRELYDAFPPARAAMDRIQAAAGWNVLALLDEPDLERINATRWQIPYLFLLEYAQWSYFVSLGLSPTLLCGHSLGELIALCCAGIYSPEVAWYILDTRAIHVAEMEARASRESGMLAVHADLSVIEEIRCIWPSIYVSNYNTPTQFILCGPREELLEARNRLRKRHIPAIMLNVSLTFHHPGMRILRDLSIRRLNALEMHAPNPPILSAVTADLYPKEQPEICRYIADLDENPVRWHESVQAMWTKHGIRDFLELGPQDILCGLVGGIEPGARCIASGRKGKEAEGMRMACARLYSLGHLPHAAVSARTKARESRESSTPQPSPPRTPTRESLTASHDVDENGMRLVFALLAKASGRAEDSLRPEMDLRYDLALRSSSFPLLIQEAEQRLHRNIGFEDLLQVVTVGDLVRVLTGVPVQASNHSSPSRHFPENWPSTPPLCRFLPADPLPKALPLNPEGQGLPLRSGDVLALCFPDETLFPEALRCIAAMGLVLAVPESMRSSCAWLERYGSRVVSFPLPATLPFLTLREAEAAINALRKAQGRVDGLLFAAPSSCQEDQVADCLEAWLRGAGKGGLRYVVCLRGLERLPEKTSGIGDILALRLTSLAAENGFVWRDISLLHGGEWLPPNELGDMLFREMLCGEEKRVLWGRARDVCRGDDACAVQGQPLHPSPERFPLVFTDASSPQAATSTHFQGCCHFSRFADPALSLHGAAPRLPQSRALQALLEATTLFLPRLRVAGLSDVRFHTLPLLPAGVTRECRVAVDAGPWLLHDRVMTRLVGAVLNVREISANGRHTDAYAPIIDGTVLLAAHPQTLQRIWAQPSGAAPDPEKGAALVALFYELTGMGPPWRLLHGFASPCENEYVVSFLSPEKSVAPETQTGYIDFLRMVEGVAQATALAAATRDVDISGETAVSGSEAFAAHLRRWRMSAAGFILFGEVEDASAQWFLTFRRSWSDERLQRFDAQVLDAGQNVLLTLYHLEFEHTEQTLPA